MKLTKEDADRIREQTDADFGDLVPVGEAPSPEEMEQISVIARILHGVCRHALEGTMAATLHKNFGKAAPLLARRMTERFPRDSGE